jgi:hypothetical protein
VCHVCAQSCVSREGGGRSMGKFVYVSGIPYLTVKM